MNRKISFFALIATLFFLMLTIVLGFVIHYVGDTSEPIFWLLSTLFVGMFIALLTCLSNLSTSIKIHQQMLDTSTQDVEFTTCPDYWTKHIVFDKTSRKKTVMCYNHFKDDIFIDGDLQGENYSFDPNSSFANSNIQDLRALATYPENQTETFIQYYTDPGDPEYHKHKHFHTRIDKIVHSNLNIYDGSVEIPEHGHVYENVSSGHHSHSGLPNGNEIEHTSRSYTVTDSNFDNWINPYKIPNKNHYAIEINLNQLNAATNKCELASMFAWSDASVQCNK